MRALRLLLGSLGLAAAAVAVGLLVLGKQSRTWPSTEGRLLEVHVRGFGSVPLGRGGTTPLDAPLIRYTYVVDDARHEGTSLSLWDVAYTRRFPLKGRLAALASADSVRVYYDPSKPSRAVLFPGPPIGAITLLGLAGTTFGALAILFPWLVAFSQRDVYSGT